MDKHTLKNICENKLVLKKFFSGIERFETLEKSNLSLKQKGNFIILNIADSHWIVAQKINKKVVRIFDSLSGKMLPSKNHISKLFQKIMKINDVLILFDFKPSRPLQSNTALSCGEHCIFYLLFSCYNFTIYRHFFKCGFYYDFLKQRSLEKNSTPDGYVWVEVYDKLKLAKKPNLEAVCNWICDKLI